MKINFFSNTSWPSLLGLSFTLVLVSLMGCKRPPQHIHNGPEYHRVNQSLTVPIEVRQSHDSDGSQKFILSPGTGPKLNLNLPGKSTQSVTNNNSKNMTSSFNKLNADASSPPAYTE